MLPQPVRQLLSSLSCIVLSLSRSPLIMVLEDRGVNKQAFLDLQRDAVAAIHMSSDSVMQCRQLFREHSLGGSYRLSYVWQLLNAIQMGMEHEKNIRMVLKDPFFERLVQFAKNDVLRSIKHNARIPVHDNFLLVGVADEGPAYEAEGCTNVFKLEEGQIFGRSSSISFTSILLIRTSLRPEVS